MSMFSKFSFFWNDRMVIPKTPAVAFGVIHEHISTTCRKLLGHPGHPGAPRPRGEPLISTTQPYTIYPRHVSFALRRSILAWMSILCTGLMSEYGMMDGSRFNISQKCDVIYVWVLYHLMFMAGNLSVF